MYEKCFEATVLVLCARSLDLHKQTVLQAQLPSATTERTQLLWFMPHISAAFLAVVIATHDPVSE